MKNEPLADPVLGASDALSSMTSEDLTPPPEARGHQSRTALSSELSDLDSEMYE
jgi:hypothetical protein